MKKPEELPEERLLTNLIEEAGELVQAATKLLRVFSGDTPVEEAAARANLIEEMADVMLCIQVKVTLPEYMQMSQICTEKYRRWIRRINEEGREHEQTGRNDK